MRTKPSTDPLIIGGQEFDSRLLVGTGKYPSDEMIPDIAAASGSRIITVALRRVDFEAATDNVMQHIPDHMQLLPNTSGARTAEEAVRIARLARATGCGNWVKIEVIPDNRHLLPEGNETVRATRILVEEGFVVLPYINADPIVARQLEDAGAAAVMPLGAPIGTNRGLTTREMLQIIIDEIKVPVVVDAGIGKPSQACEAMEMGADACLVNTAIASAADPVGMAGAFAAAIRAGRDAWRAGPGAIRSAAAASSPLTGFLYEQTDPS
ncbi:thiazole synthase [Desulfosarcina alkanivorans]|uniref:Thiazole synthase n=1 Tax=Desulfosarcina alkanivorans TaxID=571177 RepID=A0A5K7YUJ9_9BACT|nr:thiazole synthase [Desulfosarcina alkanivorans]BBO71970.1 thiazole synthase [Desulfosarcina alkanivorans]